MKLHTESVVEAIKMKLMIRPKMATPSGRKQIAFGACPPICLPGRMDTKKVTSKYE